MSNIRTTKTVTTPGGHIVVFYDYITGGELRRIQALYTEGLSAQDVVEGGSVTLSKIPASIVFKAQNLALEMLLVSVNGEEVEPAKAAQDLPPADLDFLIAEIDQFTSGVATKKNSNPV